MRKIEVYNNEHGWVESKWEDVKKGDIVQLFEPTGEIVVDEGQTIFIAITDSFIYEDGNYNFLYRFIRH